MVTVQTGSVSLTTPQEITITAVNLDNAWISVQYMAAQSPYRENILASFVNSTTIRLEKSDSTGVVTVVWTVIEDPNATVQYISGSFTGATSSAPATFDHTKTFPVFSAMNSEVNAGLMDRAFLYCELNNGTQWTIGRQSAGSTVTFGLFLVTISDCTVQQVYTNFLATENNKNLTISSVDLTQSFLTLSNSSSSSALTDRHTVGKITNTTTVNYERTRQSGTQEIRGYVVSCPRFTVQTANSGYLTTTPVNQTITAVDLSRTFWTTSSRNNGTGTSSANSKYTTELTSTTNWRRTKQAASQQTEAHDFIVTVADPLPPAPEEDPYTFVKVHDGISWKYRPVKQYNPTTEQWEFAILKRYSNSAWRPILN